MSKNLMATLCKEGTISRRSVAGGSATVRSRLAVRSENIAHGRARESGPGARKGSGEGVGHVTVIVTETEKIGKEKRLEKEVVRGHVSTRIGDPGTTS